MAIINIQLDTTRGDTLEGILHALMTSSRLEYPKYPEPKPNFNEPNPFDENDNRNARPNGGYPADAVTDKITLTGAGATSAGPVVVDQNAAIIGTLTGRTREPELGPMDGDRKRGEPGAGHRRRTNKQIEEDEAYFKQRGPAAVAAMEMGVEGQSATIPTDAIQQAAGQPKTATTPSAEPKDVAAISSGAERTNPEDDAQDAADEAAESDAKRGGAPTLDDLRKVIGEYQKKFGMAQAAAKTLEYTGGPIFEVPSKDIPLVISRWQTAIEHDTLNGAKFTPAKPAEEKSAIQVATREQVNAVINDYATRFDGSLDPAKMTHTKADIPRIMERLFGAGKNNFNAIERTPENYGRVIAAIQAEIGTNTFGRAAK